MKNINLVQSFTMRRISRSNEISACTASFKEEGYSIGFVPTMGALHKGHAALIRKAKQENDKVICSIFVNPLQFNNKKDFDTYPNKLENDFRLLEAENCDVVFLPEKEDLYGEKPTLEFELGPLGSLMEGEKRPGHFNGMAAVVKRFLEVVQPTRAYFGEKDFQQLAIVRWLNKRFELGVNIVGCKTVRESSGLALSSRNLLLTQEELSIASLVFETLTYCKNQYLRQDPIQLQKECIDLLSDKFHVEYFLIVDEKELQPLKKWDENVKPRAFVAARLRTIRLIDNLALID